MSGRILLCLEESDLIEIQRLIVDEDEQGALDFLTSVVWPKLDATMRGGLRKEIDSNQGVDRF